MHTDTCSRTFSYCFILCWLDVVDDESERRRYGTRHLPNKLCVLEMAVEAQELVVPEEPALESLMYVQMV